MGVTFRNITVGDNQYGTSERVQCLEHGSQSRLVNRLEYLIQNQKVQSLAIITVTVHEFCMARMVARFTRAASPAENLPNDPQSMPSRNSEMEIFSRTLPLLRTV